MCSCVQVIAVTQAIIRPDEGGSLLLEYFLRLWTGQEDEVLYGLRVDKRSPDGVLIEREETPALTGSIEEATALAKRFAKGTVPPCVLLEMVDEWYGDLGIPSSIHSTGEECITEGPEADLAKTGMTSMPTHD